MARTKVAKCDSNGRLSRGGPVCASSPAMTGSRSARMRAAAVKLTFRRETSVVAVMLQV
jgi:hypothetical protein